MDYSYYTGIYFYEVNIITLEKITFLLCFIITIWNANISFPASCGGKDKQLKNWLSSF